MKRITVGRGVDCDIIIADETDNVSRHHLVITFDLFGRMKISDTSSNGTFINDTRMLKGASIPVTTKDKIRLGKSWEFDWSQVKDPYRATRIWLVVMIVLAIVAAAGVLAYTAYKEKERKASQQTELQFNGVEERDTTWNKDSTNSVAPTETAIEITDGSGAAKRDKNNGKSATKKRSQSRKQTETKKENPEKRNSDKKSAKNADDSKSDRVSEKKMEKEPSREMKTMDKPLDK